MEFLVLGKVIAIVNGIVNAGYVFAGSYVVRIGYRYVQDYREAIARENEVR